MYVYLILWFCVFVFVFACICICAEPGKVRVSRDGSIRQLYKDLWMHFAIFIWISDYILCLFVLVFVFVLLCFCVCAEPGKVRVSRDGSIRQLDEDLWAHFAISAGTKHLSLKLTSGMHFTWRRYHFSFDEILVFVFVFVIRLTRSIFHLNSPSGCILPRRRYRFSLDEILFGVKNIVVYVQIFHENNKG